jgi:hypothetical protein
VTGIKSLTKRLALLQGKRAYSGPLVLSWPLTVNDGVFST